MIVIFNYFFFYFQFKPAAQRESAKRYEKYIFNSIYTISKDLLAERAQPLSVHVH